MVKKKGYWTKHIRPIMDLAFGGIMLKLFNYSWSEWLVVIIAAYLCVSLIEMFWGYLEAQK